MNCLVSLVDGTSFATQGDSAAFLYQKRCPKGHNIILMSETFDTVIPVSELLQKTGRAITSEIELEKLVQRITDVATELSGAQFGAFFYNVENESGEIYSLYTISGVAREAFSKFPMPRNTKIFAPTFKGEGTVRYDDVTKQPHYGQNAPYKGMPAGHLPVRSYLAVPVISPVDREVIGGLFFGHSDVGVFTKRSEELVEGIALQAAIAMANAKVFEQKKRAEKVLVEQRNRYSSIFNSAFDAIIIFDQEGIIAEANPAAKNLLGFEDAELIGIHGADLMQNLNHFYGIKEIVYSGRRYDNVAVMKRQNGTLLDVHMRCSDFIFRDRPHILAVIRDISAEKQKDEALVKSERFSDIIASTSPVALWMVDADGKIVYVNQTWLDWTGLTADGIYHNKMDSPVYAEDKSRINEEFQNAFRTRSIVTIEFRIIDRNGSIRWCTSKGTPYYNNKGQFEGYAGSTMDITERKLSEKKLESQNILINTIANNTQYALLMMNDKQYCTYMNPAAEEMTGFKLAEVQDKPLHYYIHHTHPDGRHFPIEDCPIDRALPTKMQTQGEGMFIHKKGHFYPVAFTASPIIDNGVPVGTVIEARDTTLEKVMQQELLDREQREKELLEEKVKARTAELEKTNYELLQFTSVASHDLKEPLRKISIFGNMLKDKMEEIGDTSTQKYLKHILDSSARMTALIDDLLTFSRLSQNETVFEEVDLNHTLKQILTDLEIPITEKHAKVSIGKMPTVKGIELQLGQVFQNLISNSLKFADPGRTPEISISADKAEIEGQNFYTIIFKDNGIGFKPEYGQKIFELFQRLHTKDKVEGTGIGLAIVKKIITLHGGNIKAEGAENVGATFLITLPENATNR